MLKHKLLHSPTELPRPDEDLTGIFTYPDGKHAALFVSYSLEAYQWLFLSTVKGLRDIEVSRYCSQTSASFTGWLYYSDYSKLLDSLLSGESLHYRKVKQFMTLIEEEQCKAGIHESKTTKVSSKPHSIPKYLLEIRVRLLLEELQELLDAANMGLGFLGGRIDQADINLTLLSAIYKDGDIDLTACADALADISVINTGTLIAFGIKDLELLNEVDENNLSKLTGSFSIRSDGKLLKPANHTPPDISAVLSNHTPNEDDLLN